VEAVQSALAQADGSIRYNLEGMENVDLDIGAILRGKSAV